MREKESFAVDEEVDLSFSSSRNGKRRNGQICYDSWTHTSNMRGWYYERLFWRRILCRRTSKVQSICSVPSRLGWEGWWGSFVTFAYKTRSKVSESCVWIMNHLVPSMVYGENANQMQCESIIDLIRLTKALEEKEIVSKPLLLNSALVDALSALVLSPPFSWSNGKQQLWMAAKASVLFPLTVRRTWSS